MNRIFKVSTVVAGVCHGVSIADAATRPCTSETMSGDWELVAYRNDGSPADYSCRLTLDAAGVVVWSDCERKGPGGFRFEIKGWFQIDPDGSIAGLVTESGDSFLIAARISGCADVSRSGLSLRGTVYPERGWVRPVIPFRGWPLAPETSDLEPPPDLPPISPAQPEGGMILPD